MSSSEINLESCRIPLEEIIRATKNFSSETQIGDGGFGMVYRGQLSEQWENRLVAIKRRHPSNGYQGNTEFNNELQMFSNFNHPNIIAFIGYCDDADEKILVYEYAANISLDHHLRDPNKRRCLTWEQRLKICLGAAKGKMYLHSGVGEHKRVIHRDLKSANILLDENLEAKICDFGLARVSPRNQPDTHVRTRPSGTRFYIDPIYNERGRLSKESDIYSFGVVMFEMSSGMMAYAPRRVSDTAEQFLIDIVRSYYDEHQFVDGLDKLIDTTIKGQIEMSSFHMFNEIAHECINFDKMKRPTMERIIEGLQKALNVQETSGNNHYMLGENDLSVEAQVENMQGSTSGEKFDMSGEIDPSIEGQVEIMQETNGENIYMLGPKDLTIAWHNDTRYWKMGRTWGSRFRKVWILREVCWIKIEGDIAAVTLSQEGTYVSYLVFRTTEDCTGLDVPATSEVVSFDGVKVETENVYLQRPEDMQENYVVPQRRKDGWMETKLGEFMYKDGDDGHVHMVFKEDKVLNWKTGLIVEGIEIRPK